MIKCAAIYPDVINDEYIKKVEKYITLLTKYQYDEIFTTIHLPELSFEDQFNALKLIIDKTKETGMRIITDVGGKFINDLLKEKISGIDYIRLDCHFDITQIRELSKKLHLKGFIINASTYNEKELSELIDDIRNINESFEIRCFHNYYIKEESGLDELFAYKQDLMIKKYNLPIYYCIASHNHPRGPLYLGLSTLEKHRNMKLDDVISDLYLNYQTDAILLSDMWFNEQELYTIDHTLKLLTDDLKDIETINIKIVNEASKKERDIILRTHSFRYDSPYNLLRSVSTRRMAEKASIINTHNISERSKGSITIDNEYNKRYSGELTVVLDNYPKDVRVNVVGYLENDDDIIKLRRFREGICYQFVESKN